MGLERQDAENNARRKRRHASYNKMASKVKISTHTRESLGKEGRRLAHECPVRRNHWTKGGEEDRPARWFSASISQ